MPPYLPFLIAADHNTQDLMKMYGAYYSGLKYGDPQCINLMSEHILQLIRVVFGNRVVKESSQFCVAGSNINYIPNAASHLAQVVAKQLNLPVVDLRAPSTYVGEFGALKSIAERAEVVGANRAFVSNPSLVEGKIVIYIDDCVVSGAHLADQVRALNQARAAQVSTFCIFDVAGQDLSLEASLNYALIDTQHPVALIDILKQEEAPLLARSPKVFLRLPTEKFLFYVKQLPTWRLFDMWEQCQVEGFSQAPLFKSNIQHLEKVIAELHWKTQKEDPHQASYKLMLLDYDDTIADVLTPITDDMSYEIAWQLQQGTHICMISSQPIGERGLQEFFFDPFKQYLQQSSTFDERLLQQIYLLPCDGMMLYEIDQHSMLHVNQPRSNLGFHEKQWEVLQDLVLDHDIQSRMKDVYLRDSYISLHFFKHEDLLWAQSELIHRLSDFKPGMEVVIVKTKDPSLYVLHIRLKGMSKYVGRDWVMQWIKPEIEKQSNLKVSRETILVAGDRMGYEDGLCADQKMMVLGACNLALGQQAHDWSYQTYLGQCHQGLYEFLQKNRHYLLGKSKSC